MSDGTPTDVQLELARKANVARAVADGISDNTDAAALGRANILEDLADDLEEIGGELEAGGGES